VINFFRTICEATVPAQCPRSARTVPVTVPVTVPDCENTQFVYDSLEQEKQAEDLISLRVKHCENCVFLQSGAVTGTVTGTVRALYGHCAGIVASQIMRNNNNLVVMPHESGFG